MPYQPGLHIIATLVVTNAQLLEKYDAFKQLADNWISQYGLNKLGEVYHDFIPSGFTGIVCLSESHVSIHTWPEHNKVNLDIYLSNFLRNNDGTVDAIYQAVQHHFEGIIVAEQRISR